MGGAAKDHNIGAAIDVPLGYTLTAQLPDGSIGSVSEFWHVPFLEPALLELEYREGDSLKIGYIRVSTQEQNTVRQEVLMKDLGVDELYIDKSSGKSTDQRLELKKMMGYVRRGDTVVVESISRFARNTRDLLELVEQLSTKGVEFVSQKEAIDTTTPTGKFMLTIFGAVAELEREYILQRQREGIAIAKAEGVYTGRKPIQRPNFDQVVKLWQGGEITAVDAMRRLDLKPSTFYRKVRQAEG